MVLLLILIIGTAIAYDFKCPSQAEWRLKANVSCLAANKYVCLFHLLEKKYQDNCSGSERSSIGSNLVFQPLFNIAECNSGRYQPIVFTTDGNSECILLKSKCDEEGQAVYSNGTSGSDITCRCDYTKGYSFVSKPENNCFCKPSEEDCSCFRVECTKLSPDYECITDGETIGNTTCQEMQSQITYTRQERTVQDIKSDIKRYSYSHHVTYIIIIVIAVYIVIAVLILQVFVPPEIIEQKNITSDSGQKAIGLKCVVKSFLPLTSVKWCTKLEEVIHVEPNIDDVFSSKRTWTFTFETPEEYENGTFKCVVSNAVGTEESEPVLLYGKVYVDNERQKFIHELLLEGQCAKHHFARVVFIGKNNVGKTSLMRRLLWQNKEDVTNTESTDGIEIEKCNINVINGTWSKCDRKDDDLTRLIHQVYTEQKPDVKKVPETKPDINVYVQENLSNNTEETINTPDGGLASELTCKESNVEENDKKRLYMVTETEDSEAKVKLANKLFDETNNFVNLDYVQTEENNSNQMHPTDNILEVNDENTVKNNGYVHESSQENDENITKITSQIIKSYLQHKEHNLSANLAFCWLWDFAGQKDFYATHQVFLSKCAVFLLVTDSLEFSQTEKLWTAFEETADYVRFWVDTIHCYCSTVNKGRSDPPIIVVCTNEDKYKLMDPSERKEQHESFEDNLGKILNKQKKKEHLRTIYFVSNTEDDDSVFETIRKDISRHAMEMKDWGRDCPLKWLLFQQVLVKLKDSNVHISTTKELLKIAMHDEIGITKYEEFKNCLQYCHEIGIIIYFDEKKLKDHVILDPRWLIAAFRCLVSDKINKVSDSWQTLKETGELKESLVTLLFMKEPKLDFLENKTHLLEVMKRFDIIVTLHGSNTLYMPCAMESCSFVEVLKQFMDESHPFERTSWFCLEFEFLPPAFFNHILAWYIKEYPVSVILDQGTRFERKALYRQIGVFNFDKSGCEQFVVCEGKNIIALQVWIPRMSDQIYKELRTNLIQFVDILRDRYRMKIEYTQTFKCKDGDFTVNGKKINELLTDEYRCLEHMTNHLSDDLLKPWGIRKELHKRMADTTSKYFISHSNKREDYDLVNQIVIPKLREKGISIYEQNELLPGTPVLSSITSLVDKADKTLLFLTENSLESSWCSFELLISLDKSQRTNRLAVVLLLHKIEESQLPHIAVLQKARKIHFDEHNDEWVREVVEGLKETKTIGDIMPAGNVAHGLVWSHFSGLLQYVLPELENKVIESDWYKNLTEEVRKKVSCKLYELVPRTCAVKYDIPKEDDNIKAVTKFKFIVRRGGNERIIEIKMYSITIGQETFYCMCEFPNVIGTMKVMEDNHLAKFSHTYPGEVGEGGFTTAAQFTTEDKKLQLGRFYYTMNSTLNHFDKCKDTARVLLFNDEKKKISDVLMEAIKKDLKEENFQEMKLKESNQPPQIDRLESEEELHYEYQVYVACTDIYEDQQKAQQIMDHLRANRMADSDILDAASFLPGSSWAQKLNTASRKCRWFIFLLTKNALKDTRLNYNVISALGDSIYRRKVRVIPVVDRCDNLVIPEALRWITYIPFDINGRHLESLYSIVSGRDIPMETQMILPAGDVAYGLAWGYVTNYLMKILPEVLKGISPVFTEKAVKNFRCPHKLFIVIPKSCSAGDFLHDKQNDPGRIENFSKTAAVYPFGPGRAFNCNIYKVSLSSVNMNEGLYFVGQYAAPVTCLQEMKTWTIAGVNQETMEKEAENFYGIVSQLMRNAVPEKAQYCEFIYYDDMTDSLADIMEQKIQSMKD